MDKQFDVVILGAGPAGLTAAIYACRAGLSVAMVENSAPGGKLVKTYHIENYPGVKQSSGVDLAMAMFDQASELNAEYVAKEVAEIVANVDENHTHEVRFTDRTSLLTKAVLIATGTRERLMNIPNEIEYTGKGVSYCAVCDGAFFKDGVVTVIGGGNSALEEAQYLSTLAKQVNIVIRRDVFRADQHIQDAVQNNEKIHIITKHIPTSILTDGQKVTGIELENVDNHEKQVMETQGIFPYIGADPNTSFCKNLPILNQAGYIQVNAQMETTVAGIYAAGDVVEKVLRQVVTACNDGAIAAQAIFHYLKG